MSRVRLAATAAYLHARRTSTVLAVAASRESHLIDFANPHTRFAYDFGDGAVAALLVKERSAAPVPREVLGCHMITDGSFSLDVMVPAGGSVEPASPGTVRTGRHHLDVPDPASLKQRLDPLTLRNFLAAADGALHRSQASRRDIAYVCVIHRLHLGGHRDPLVR